MEQLVEKNKANRKAFMKVLYEINNGGINDYFDSEEIGRKIGLTDAAEIENIVSYLHSEHIIDGDFAAGASTFVKLTSYGVTLVENESNIPLSTYPSPNINNIININGDLNGNLQSGESNSINLSPDSNNKNFSVIPWLFENIGVVVSGVLVVAILSWLGFKN